MKWLKCPFCNEIAPVPLDDGDDDLCNKGDEYWMLFHPLLQIAAVNRSKMTIGTRTICRLTCLGCMQNHLHGKTIVVSNKPNVCGRSSKSRSGTATATSTSTTSTTTTIAANQPPSKLRFSLSALKVLNDAGHGSSIFPQQESPNLCHLVSHRNVNTVIDAWSLFNLWEYSGAHEALQTDYLLSLSQECIKRNYQQQQQLQLQRSRKHGSDLSKEEAHLHHCGSITAMNGVPSQRRMEAEAESDTIAGHGCTNSSSCRMMPCYLAQEDDAIMPKSINNKDRERERGHLVENRKQKSGCCCCCDIATNTAASISTSSTTSTLVTRGGGKKNRFQCNTCKAILPSTHMKQCARCKRVTYCGIEC